MDSEAVQVKTADGKSKIHIWLGIVFLVYIMMLAVGMIGSGFKWASGGEDGARRLFEFATNPFMGLLMGTMATALVQSSSTVTSVIVALVAGGLPVPIAIPMVMGANIGTTVTNTLVSMGHIRHKDEFRSAFAAATIHDFFNLLCVFLFLPLEMAFGFLEKVSYFFANLISGGGGVQVSDLNFVKTLTKPVINTLGQKGLLAGVPEPFGAVIQIVLGLIFIFFAIYFLGRLLKSALTGKANDIFHTAIGRGPVSGILSGTVITVLVQSSSTTTSLAVPLAGTGVLKLKEIYPFTLGANIGTTITALLASTAATGNKVFALEIALVHFLYNLIGVIVIYGVPFLRAIPLNFAQKLANVAADRKIYAIGYILLVFFIVPLIFMGIHELF